MMFGREFADGVINAKNPRCECHNDLPCIVRIIKKDSTASLEFSDEACA